MLRKEIKYVDFNGNERTKIAYFHMSKSELTQLELSERGGWTTVIAKIVIEDDIVKLSELFEEIILGSYGEKSPDGIEFRKSPEISAAFKATNAYDELYMSFIKDSDQAVEFLKGVMPAKIRDALSNEDMGELYSKIESGENIADLVNSK